MRWSRSPCSRVVLSAVLALAGLAPAGCNDCDFFERCDGSVREVCGQGPDQVVGREVHRFPCEAPNGACVEVGRRSFCVVDPVEVCVAATHVASCDGPSLLACPSDVGHVLAEDCTLTGQTCEPSGSGAACRGP